MQQRFKRTLNRNCIYCKKSKENWRILKETWKKEGVTINQMNQISKNIKEQVSTTLKISLEQIKNNITNAPKSFTKKMDKSADWIKSEVMEQVEDLLNSKDKNQEGIEILSKLQGLELKIAKRKAEL